MRSELRRALVSYQYYHMLLLTLAGLGEASGAWETSHEGLECMRVLLEWSVFVTKERRLAHVVLSGNEKFVLQRADTFRDTRGPSFAYSLPVHSFHARRDRVASLFAWRGHTKRLTTRARPSPDLAVWLE